jgi:hypothetical protein
MAARSPHVSYQEKSGGLALGMSILHFDSNEHTGDLSKEPSIRFRKTETSSAN